MTTTVDARGLPCPQPVIRTRKALQSGDSVLTIVDNETAQHNVTRMAEKQGCTVSAETRADDIYLAIARSAEAPVTVAHAPATPGSGAGPLVLLVSSEVFGRGEYAELGQILIRGFFHTLGEVEPQPQTIILLNSGVKLVVKDSPVLEGLLALRDAGIEILACGTCLDYYGLKDQVAVGLISNMYTIAEALLGAGKVLNL